MSGLHIAVLVPFLAACVIPLFARTKQPIHTGWFVLLLPLVLFTYFIRFLPVLWKYETVTQTAPWIPSLGINFTLYIDGLSLLFALLITGIGALVVLYSIYYLSKQEALHRFYVFLLMFMGAMLGVVLSDNLLVMYVFWELTSVASFLLIGYWYHRERSKYGAQKSLLITFAGGFAMLAGIILLFTVTGTFSIRETIAQMDTIIHSPFYPAILILVLLGAFTKSAQFPFYIWLPDAMEAPTPVSAYLHSATMVKAGIYLLARLTPVLGGTDAWFWTISCVGLFTMVWGSFMAIRQTDLKGILAFSTVSQLGLIVSLLGYGGPLAVLTAVFHLFNHAAFKGSLFMVAGIVDHETGTRDLRKLGGLYSLMPITATLAFVGSFAMAGLPPTNGFLSKEMFFQASINLTEQDQWWVVFPIVALVGSIFTFVYSMMLSFKVFMGKRRSEQTERPIHEPPTGMLLSPAILGLVVLIVGFVPGLIANSLLGPVVESILMNARADIVIEHWHGFFDPALMMTIGVILIGTFIYVGLAKWLSIYRIFPNSLSLNRLYDRLLAGMASASRRVMHFHMTGYLRDYLLYILTFIVLFIGYVFWQQQGFSLSFTNLAAIELYEGALIATLVIAAIAVVFSQNRLSAIIAVGVVGFMLSLLFVNFRAPDLALTQLVVETVTVALFLLCFYHLPKLKKETVERRVRIGNVLISLGVGVLFTLIALSAHSNKLFNSISEFYVENAYDEAGGQNIVNVILVDFRGVDTMLEILVLGIAALGVFALIKLRLEGGGARENK